MYHFHQSLAAWFFHYKNIARTRIVEFRKKLYWVAWQHTDRQSIHESDSCFGKNGSQFEIEKDVRIWNRFSDLKNILLVIDKARNDFELGAKRPDSLNKK